MELIASARPTILKWDRTDWAAIAAIIAVALIPRLLLLSSLPPILHLDSGSYFEIAQRLQGGLRVGAAMDLSRRTPLYPFLLSLAGHGRAGLVPVILLQHALGIVSALLCYLIARRLFPSRRWVSLGAGLLTGAVVYPVLLEQSILSEPLFGFVFLAAVWFLLVWYEEERAWMAAASGAAFALTALARPIGAGLFVVAVGVLMALPGRKQTARFLLFGGSAFALLLAPLLWRNHAAMGRYAISESLGRNLISVTDRLVDYDHGIELPVKSVYRPFLKEKRSPDAVVVYAAMPALRRATHQSDAEIDRALARVAWEAIRAYPVEYLSGRLRRLPLLFRDPGESESYALHAETYLPLVEFVGRSNPELVARSVSNDAVKNAQFDRAALIDRIFAIDLTSGWLFLFPLAGFVWAVRCERRGAGWLVAGLLAWLWMSTILVQPPNARYRIPTLPLEIVFAVAGYGMAVEAVVGVGNRARAARRAKTKVRAISAASDRGCWAMAAAIVAIFALRLVWALETKKVFQVADFQKSGESAPVSGVGTEQRPEVRELTMAGRKLPVLYWNGGNESAGIASRTISAEAPLSGGLALRVQAAYSCELPECAAATLRLAFLDSQEAPLGPEASLALPLAHERIDNDLFWDQIDSRLRAPARARAVRVELEVQPGKGNLVIPYFSIESVPAP